MDELAEDVQRKAVEHYRAGVEHHHRAIRNFWACGRLLVGIKQALPHGSFSSRGTRGEGIGRNHGKPTYADCPEIQRGRNRGLLKCSVGAEGSSGALLTRTYARGIRARRSNRGAGGKKRPPSREIDGLETDVAEAERDVEALARDMAGLRLCITNGGKAA